MVLEELITSLKFDVSGIENVRSASSQFQGFTQNVQQSSGKLGKLQAFANIGQQVFQVGQQAQQAGTGVSGFAQGLMQLHPAGRAVSAAMDTAGAAVEKFGFAPARQAKAMDEWADSLGTTANEYSKLTAAIRLTNKTAEQAASIAQGGLNAIAPSLKAAQTGDEAAQAKFQKHGIATNNADGSARDTVAVLKDLTGVLADLKNKGDVKGASELTQEFGLSQEFETFAKSLKGGAEAMAKFEEGAKRAVVQSDFQKDLNKKAGEIEARSQLANEEINAMVSTVTQTIAVGAGEVWTRMKEGVVALAKGDGGNPQKGQALYDNGDGTFSTAAADIKSAAENLKALESARSAERQVANIAGDRQASKGGAQSVEINTSSDVQANVQVSGLVTEAELRKKIEAELMPKIEAKIAKGMSLGGGNMLVTR